jgi:hypothetical protein
MKLNTSPDSRVNPTHLFHQCEYVNVYVIVHLFAVIRSFVGDIDVDLDDFSELNCTRSDVQRAIAESAVRQSVSEGIQRFGSEISVRTVLHCIVDYGRVL